MVLTVQIVKLNLDKESSVLHYVFISSCTKWNFQASRALILNKATDYIKSLKGKNMCHKKEIDDIKKQNDVLEQESKLPIYISCPTIPPQFLTGWVREISLKNILGKIINVRKFVAMFYRN